MAAAATAWLPVIEVPLIDAEPVRYRPPPTFAELHLVANGASEVLAQVFGKDGMHAQSAFGVAQAVRVLVEKDPIAEMERLYKLVNAASETDHAVLNEARQELVKLQSSDEENLRIWREMIALSQAQFDTIYCRLGVKFDHTLGESFYHPRLQPLVEELFERGIARQSEGAMAVFFEDMPHL